MLFMQQLRLSADFLSRKLCQGNMRVSSGHAWPSFWMVPPPVAADCFTLMVQSTTKVRHTAMLFLDSVGVQRKPCVILLAQYAPGYSREQADLARASDFVYLERVTFIHSLE
jgi:hypothetical protein